MGTHPVAQFAKLYFQQQNNVNIPSIPECLLAIWLFKSRCYCSVLYVPPLSIKLINGSFFALLNTLEECYKASETFLTLLYLKSTLQAQYYEPVPP